MQIDFEHRVEYTNKNIISTADIANSLIANEYLVKSIKDILEECFDGVKIEDIKIRFR